MNFKSNFLFHNCLHEVLLLNKKDFAEVYSSHIKQFLDT
jgi:hypothetical protein